MQNQPNRDKQQRKIVRSAFIPSKRNHLMPADFSGIEVGNSCCNHKDPVMLDYVRHPEKNDMHRDMAIQLYQLDDFKKEGTEKTLRKGAKNGFVFPQFYGDYYGNNAPSLCFWAGLPIKGNFKEKDGLLLMTGKHMGEHMIQKGITCFDDYVAYIRDVEYDFWNNRFKVYKKWKEKNVKSYYKKGYLNTLTGFTCSGIMSKNDINNYPIQGPAFHSLLKTFIETDKRLERYRFKSKLIGQIHDELVFDTDPKETQNVLDLVQEIACVWLPKKWKWIIVPLEIEADIFGVDANWSTEAETVKLKAA